MWFKHATFGLLDIKCYIPTHPSRNLLSYVTLAKVTHHTNWRDIHLLCYIFEDRLHIPTALNAWIIFEILEAGWSFPVCKEGGDGMSLHLSVNKWVSRFHSKRWLPKTQILYVSSVLWSGEHILQSTKYKRHSWSRVWNSLSKPKCYLVGFNCLFCSKLTKTCWYFHSYTCVGRYIL